VVDGETGIVIPPENQEALRAAILRLYGNRGLAAQMGQAGRERVVARFTWEHFRARLRELYADVISNQ
jgi:glycosyltransferase involved in cell wall biosynthesis